MSKKVTIIVILVVIIIALYFAMKKPSQEEAPAPVQTASNVQASTTQPAVNTVPVNPSVEQIKGSGSSDASLSQDTASIDAQLKNLQSDTSAIGN